MSDAAPLLFSFDLTDTLARIDGVSHVQLIRGASPLPADQVNAILEHDLRLKTLPSRTALTPELLEHVCRLLHIRPEEFPYGLMPPAPCVLLPGADVAFAAAASHLPAIVITNTSVFADPALEPVVRGLGPHLAAVHPSWAMGVAKPDRRAFQVAAGFHGTTPERMIHIGDSWRHDVAPVLALGGRAVWLNPGLRAAPGSEPVPPGRLLVATTLAEAVDQAVARWLTGPSRT